MPSASASARDLPTTLRRASETLPSAFRCGYRLNDWNTMPIFCRTRFRSTPGRVMSVPSTTTEPLEGSSSRLQQRSSVDLPEPDGPMMNTSSPCATARSMPFSTSRVPKDLCSAMTSRMPMWLFLNGVPAFAGTTAFALAALRRIWTGVVAFHARHAVARRDFVDPGILLRLNPEPLLVQARHRAIELHALQHVVHRRAALLVIEAEGHRPDKARLVEVGGFHRRVLLGCPEHDRVPGHVCVGTVGKYGLHRVGVGAVHVELETVLVGVSLSPGLVRRALIEGDGLPLQVLQATDRFIVLPLEEHVVRLHVTLGEQHRLSALRRHGGRRNQEVVLLSVHARDQRAELRTVDLDRPVEPLRQLVGEIDVEALEAAARLGHGMRREGRVDARADGLLRERSSRESDKEQ